MVYLLIVINVIRINSSKTIEDIGKYNKINIASSLRSNSLNSIHSHLFDIVEINDGVNYFKNYNDVKITPEEFKKESQKYLKKAVSELGHYNKIIYESMITLEDKDKLRKFSKYDNVTIFFSDSEQKNYSLI